MRTKDQLGRSTALGFVLHALEAAEKLIDAEETNARPVIVSMYSRRTEANMRAGGCHRVVPARETATSPAT